MRRVNLADHCHECGRPAELPSITPELLFFRASTPGGPAAPRVAAFLPDGRRAVAFAGVVYAMTAEDWRQVERMRAAWQSLPLDAAAAA